MQTNQIKKNNTDNINEKKENRKNNKLLLLIDDLKQKHDFGKCNELLRKEIIYIYTKKVQKHYKDYLYSTPVELLEALKVYMQPNEYKPFVDFIILSFNDEYMDFEKTEKLLNIYNSIFR